MLNNTIHILIRKARMDGKNACWVPTDHASIAAGIQSGQDAA
ncbi:MAG: hypothetical protein U0T36_03155 [Saprospiraceae bacterium]